MNLRSICLATLAGCAFGSCAAPKAVTPAHVAAVAGTWIPTTPVPRGARTPTFTIEGDGRLHGNGGVNSFRGLIDAAAVGRGQWQVQRLDVTEMAGPVPAMEFETTLLTQIASADRVALLGDALLLLLQGEKTLVRFERAWMR